MRVPAVFSQFMARTRQEPSQANSTMSKNDKESVEEVQKAYDSSKHEVSARDASEGVIAVGMCRSCNQMWIDEDVQMLPNSDSHNHQLVKWAKFYTKTNSEGVEERTPQCHECLACFGTRRKHFNGVQQAELNRCRSESKKLNQLYSECRFDKVNSIKRKGAYDIKEIISKHE